MTIEANYRIINQRRRGSGQSGDTHDQDWRDHGKNEAAQAHEPGLHIQQSFLQLLRVEVPAITAFSVFQHSLGQKILLSLREEPRVSWIRRDKGKEDTADGDGNGTAYEEHYSPWGSGKACVLSNAVHEQRAHDLCETVHADPDAAVFISWGTNKSNKPITYPTRVACWSF